MVIKCYKDWGAWNLMAEKFAKNGFYFVKFNFSHNGTTLDKPTAFEDLESFGQNNYSKELSDLEFVINYFSNDNSRCRKISLIGHSRGGGIAIIEALENSKIKNLSLWQVQILLDRFPADEKLEDWKKNGVYYNYNSRTKQQMPHDIQFLEDYLANKERFSVEKQFNVLTVSY